jgi:hypothetical protein
VAGTGTEPGDFVEWLPAATGANGVAVLTSIGTAKKPAFEFCVSGITDSLLYAPGDNVVDCASYP